MSAHHPALARTQTSLRAGLCLVLGMFLLTGAGTEPDAGDRHLATSWLEIRSLPEPDLAGISSGANSISNQITARALLTQAERNLSRSYASASAQLIAAQKLIEPGSDEAAFAAGISCQIAHRQAKPDSHNHCLQLDNLGYEVRSPVVSTFVSLTKALYLSREGHHKDARSIVEQATQLAQRSTDARLIAETNNWLGVQFSIERLPKLALVHYEIAWKHAEQTPTPELKQIIKFNLASAYSQIGRHEEALTIFEEAMTWPLWTVDATRNAIFRAVVALTLIGANEPERAEQLLLEIIPQGLRNVQDDTAVQVYSSLAQTQLAQGRVSEAMSNFEKSIGFLGSRQNPRGNAAKVPYASALRQSGRASDAREILESIIKQLPNGSPNELLLDALTELAAVNTSLGNTAGAAQASARAARVNEQLQSVALEYQLSRMQNALELDKQEQELELARERELAFQTIAKREATLRYFSLVLAALLLAVVYLYFSRRLQTKVMQAERTANERLEAQVESRTRELETQMANRLQAEVERRDLLSKLAEGEKMRALGQLTAGVAHDFNNLMTAVTLTAEYLKTDSGDGEHSREALLDDILSATDSAASITSGLLAYARQQPLQPKTLQLDEFLEESELIFSNALGERNLLRTSYVPCSVVVDQGQLASALLNLLLNAKEALGERGTVEITLTLEQGSGERLNEEFAVISVRDSGTGMTQNDLQRATEPFFTTKPAGEGTGLGLSMVYGFAHQSGGDLSLQSEFGKGTTVRLELPAAAAAVADPEAREVVQHLSLPANLRILIVEDRDSVLQMLKLSLEHLGLIADTACNAEAALASVRNLGPPDVLLSDIQMPGELDGNQLARMLKKRYPDMPIVMMSGYSETLEEGHEFLHKPFTNDQLKKTLLRALYGTTRVIDSNSGQKSA